MLFSKFRFSVPILFFYLAVTICSLSANAQSNQQANVLLEVQQLRNEIAELRDMVERQQYELSRLKRLQQAPQNTVQVETAENGEQLVSPETAQDYREVQADDYNRAVQTTNQPFETREYSIGGQAPVVEPEASVGTQAGTQAVEIDGDSYPPVEGRTITAPTPSVDSESDGRPPVVDLSIGREGEAKTVENVEASQVIVEERLGQTSVPVGAATPTTSQAANASSGGGIVPIPSTSSTVSRDGTEYREVVIQGDNGNFSNNSTTQSNAGQNQIVDTQEKQYYDQAFDYLKEYKYPEAIQSFKQQIQLYPNGEWADDAHYWIAESNYLNRNLSESKRYFRAIIDNFEGSPRLPDAMLKTAYIEEEQGNQIEARILLQEIIQYYPRSDAANSAKNRLAKLTQ